MKLLLFDVDMNLIFFCELNGVCRAVALQFDDVFPAPNRVLDEHTEARVDENLLIVGVFGVVDA